MEEIKEVEPTMVYPVKEDHVYAVCRCPLPMEYALDRFLSFSNYEVNDLYIL